MPYCPNCKYEYETGITECPDCAVALLPGSPPVAEKNPDDEVDAVVLMKTYDDLHARLVASALDEAGIPYRARGLGMVDSLGGAMGGYVPQGPISSPGPIIVFVNPSDLDRAKEIVESMQGEELTDEEITDDSGENT